MTVCIAALCQWNGSPYVIGMSDRMLTSGDVSFQPPEPKIYALTNSIYVMTSGDAAIHAEIYQKVWDRVDKLITAKPQEWVKVETVARIYGEEIVGYIKRTASRLVLEPMGLTFDSFFAKQKEMSAEFVDEVSARLLSVKSESRVIVGGLDETGGHIWAVDFNGKPSCADKAGFVAIGVGKRHAESEFMFSAHSPRATYSQTLLRTYTAKKRAEVAPGVGDRTDMFIIGSLGQAVLMVDEERDSYLPQLHQAYQKMIEKAEQAKKESTQEIHELFEALLKQQMEEAAQKQSASMPPLPLSDSEKSEPKK